MARLKGDSIISRYDTEEEKRASLQPGGKHHHHVVEGGAWRRHRDMWIARRDGDTATLARLEAKQEASLAGTVCEVQAALVQAKDGLGVAPKPIGEV